MNNIFRAPVDNQHYKDTIKRGMSLDKVAKFLSRSEKARLRKIAKGAVVRYWGSIPGLNNTRTFQRLSAGDEILCYRSGKYIALAKVAFKTVSRDLAKYSWGETEGGTTWELIYFFSEVFFFEIDSGIIHKEFNYQDGPVMGFSAISEDRSKKFLQKYGSVERFIKGLDYEERIKETVSEEISKRKIGTPYEAQFYLIDLGNQLEFETYVPPNDAGREVFGKKLRELITIRRGDLEQYVAPAILEPLSNIDVTWFKEHYRPKFFYEVVHKTGMTTAFARLKAVAEYYDTAKTRIVGTDENKDYFDKSRRLYFPRSEQISYKLYGDLVKVHSESLRYRRLVEEFLR